MAFESTEQTSPFASFPRVNPAMDMADMMTAMRGYESNVAAMGLVNNMINSTVDRGDVRRAFQFGALAERYCSKVNHQCRAAGDNDFVVLRRRHVAQSTHWQIRCYISF